MPEEPSTGHAHGRATKRGGVHESKSTQTKQTSKGVHQKHHEETPNTNVQPDPSRQVQLPRSNRGTPNPNQGTSQRVHRGVHRRTQRNGQRRTKNPNNRGHSKTNGEAVRRSTRRRRPNQVRPNSSKVRRLVQKRTHTHTRRCVPGAKKYRIRNTPEADNQRLAEKHETRWKNTKKKIKLRQTGGRSKPPKNTGSTDAETPETLHHNKQQQ